MTVSSWRFALILLPLAWMACSAGRQENGAPDTGSVVTTAGTGLGTLPATYAGTLPCADCPGIRYTLNLLPEGIFFLRMVYLERATTFDDIGTWSLTEGDTRLLLRGGRQSSDMFAITGPSVLRKLDGQGKEITAQLNFDLTRAGRFEPFEPRLTMRGVYSSTDDGGVFTECATQLKLPVAREGENGALEAAYIKARRQPGEEMLANLEGHLAMRPQADGSGEERTLVVDAFTSVVPGETCGGGSGAAELRNTYWKLVEAGGTPVTTGPDRREAQMTLSLEDMNVKGFSGCNGFSGSYTLDGHSLRFGSIMSTRMACADGMDVENRFFAAMNATASYAITGWSKGKPATSLNALTGVRALSSTVAVSISPGAEDDQVGIRGLVRVSARTPGELEYADERLSTISDRLGITLTPLRGLQVAGLAATLPLGGRA